MPDECSPFLIIAPNPANSNVGLAVDLIYPPADPCPPEFLNNFRTGAGNQIKVYDFYGNLVYKNEYTTNSTKLDNLNLKTGLYTINVFTSEGYNKRTTLAIK